jgi:tetratricopeptide (TPR) repeat protein
MRKTTAFGLVLAAGVLAVCVAGYHARRSEQAQELVRRAERLLHPPLAEATSWQDVRAAEARDLLEEAQALASSPPAAALLVQAEIIQQLQRGAYEEAEQRLASLPRAEQDAQLVLLRVATALALKNTAAAQRALTQLSGADRDQPRALMLRSDLARALGRGDEALASAQRGLALDADSAALHERRGLAYELLGDWQRARADLERAAELDRRATSALLALGRVLRSMGDARSAVLAFHTATQRNPAEAEGWLGSGVCRAAFGDNTAARVDLERAAELAPRRAEPLLALADVDVAQGDLASALGRYRAAVLLDPGSATARVKLGNTLLRSGAIQDAAPAFRDAIERRPDLGAAHNGLGAALLAQGDLQGAESELKAAASLDPDDVHPLLNLARLYKRRGDTALLADALAQAEARDPHLLIARSSSGGTAIRTARPEQ